MLWSIPSLCVRTVAPCSVRWLPSVSPLIRLGWEDTSFSAWLGLSTRATVLFRPHNVRRACVGPQRTKQDQPGRNSRLVRTSYRVGRFVLPLLAASRSTKVCFRGISLSQGNCGTVKNVGEKSRDVASIVNTRKAQHSVRKAQGT